MDTCSVTTCEKPVDKRDLCAGHYMKSYRHGDPLYVHRRPAQDLTGQRFGELIALEREPGSKWLCRCDCGNLRSVTVGSLNSGQTRTCGERPTHPRKITVTYAGAHDRVEAQRGLARAHTCVDCGGPAKDWSYDHEDPDERHGEYGPYSCNPDHYQPRCRKCHRVFDDHPFMRRQAG